MKELIFDKIFSCRSCESKRISQIHDFGEVPVADKLIVPSNTENLVEKAPLSISFCENCSLLQINESINPILLFKYDYPYLSSSIPEVENHFLKLAEYVIEKFNVSFNDQIVEIAGNDGVLLKNFLPFTKNLLNIEPSVNPAKVAQNLGIEIIDEFFDLKTALFLKSKRSLNPKFIFAANVLAHVPNPDNFAKGLYELASDETIIIIEVPHLLPMIENNIFDVIFHQHYSYFSLHALKHLFEKNNLNISNIQKIYTQGGGLRLYLSKIKNDAPIKIVNTILEEEKKASITSLSRILQFSKKILKIKRNLNGVLKNLSVEGKSIVGYGAPGKAATLLNYFNISDKNLDYLVDISESKQGKIFPFTNLMIYPIEKLLDNPPDYILLLAWNYKDSILKNLSRYNELKKVKYILFYPEVIIIK